MPEAPTISRDETPTALETVTHLHIALGQVAGLLTDKGIRERLKAENDAPEIAAIKFINDNLVDRVRKNLALAPVSLNNFGSALATAVKGTKIFFSVIYERYIEPDFRETLLSNPQETIRGLSNQTIEDMKENPPDNNSPLSKPLFVHLLQKGIEAAAESYIGLFPKFKELLAEEVSTETETGPTLQQQIQ